MLSLPVPVLQTVVALTLAHVIADFLLQTNWMIRNKRHVGVLSLHVGIVFVLSLGALGGGLLLAGLVALSHFAIDAVKVWVLPEGYREKAPAFFGDQIAHIVAIIVLSVFLDHDLSGGLWGPFVDQLILPATYLTGFLITVIAGGYAVGVVTAPYSTRFANRGLRNAGRMIGQLERVMIFLLVVIGQPAGIGFLIAAKSFLRFESAKKQAAAEYVIIGTLSSFGWALGFATLTVKLADLF